MSVSIEKLTYIYNKKSPFEKKALDEIDLEIADGEFFGIIGHTGSGKSTLVQHLNALIRVQSGNIKIAGFDLADKKTDFKQLRGKVGMVFQYPEYQLFAETVEKDVAFGLKNFMAKPSKKGEAAPGALTPEQVRQQVKEAIELVGLNYEEVREKSPFDLSGGQKRRVAIAGVIVTRPEVLVLDEPSAGLDPQGKREILSLILELKRTCTPTIIMISHDMDEIARHADRIAVMHAGRVEFVLPPRELFKHRDRLVELGLDVPVSVKIASLLAARGFPIEPNIVDYTELADAVSRGVKGGAAC